MLPALRPEAQFLLSALKSRSGNEPQVAASFDWDFLYRFAEIHGVIPLVSRSLALARGIPAPAIERFRNQANKIFGHNIALTKQLTVLLNLFAENNIPVIPFKGPVLAQMLYGNVALRQFDDIDLMIIKQDVFRAKQLLLAAGYMPKKELEGMTAAQEKYFLKHQYSYDFVGNSPRHQLEMHWDILPKSFSLKLEYEGIWKRATGGDFEGVPVRLISPEDLLLILCIAGAKKMWRRLSRVCDIALHIERYPQLDWTQVVTQAKAAGAQRILLIGLSLASNLLDARVPEAVSGCLDKTKRSSNLVRNLTQRMFSSDIREPVTLNDQFQTLHLQMRERFADQFRYCLRVALTPGTGEWGLISLPPGLYFLYYILRPFRLVGKMIKRVVGARLTSSYGWL